MCYMIDTLTSLKLLNLTWMNSMKLSDGYISIIESNVPKMVASDVKSKIEPLIDDSIESSGEYVSNTYGTDSKEFKAWDKVTTQMYDSILEYKNMMRKL